jgi:hypothetical protein
MPAAKNETLPWLLAGLLVGALLGYLAAMALTPSSSRPVGETPGGRACTLEAKICPDGSAVGRTGPNCEFAPCPGAPVLEPIPPSGR